MMLVVFGVALLLHLSGIGRGLTPANAGRVRPGMTQGQVNAVLGPPNPVPGVAFWDEYRVLGTHYVSVTVFYDSAGQVERVKTGEFWTRPWCKFW